MRLKPHLPWIFELIQPSSYKLKKENNTMSKIKRAILSVTDKQGLVEFAKGLSGFGIEILSTGEPRRH